MVYALYFDESEFENGFNAVEMDPSWSDEDKEMKLLHAKQKALGTVAFIGSIMNGLAFGNGPIVACFIKKFGAMRGKCLRTSVGYGQ